MRVPAWTQSLGLSAARSRRADPASARRLAVLDDSTPSANGSDGRAVSRASEERDHMSPSHTAPMKNGTSESDLSPGTPRCPTRERRVRCARRSSLKSTRRKPRVQGQISRGGSLRIGIGDKTIGNTRGTGSTLAQEQGDGLLSSWIYTDHPPRKTRRTARGDARGAAFCLQPHRSDAIVVFARPRHRARGGELDTQLRDELRRARRMTHSRTVATGVRLAGPSRTGPDGRRNPSLPDRHRPIGDDTSASRSRGIAERFKAVGRRSGVRRACTPTRRTVKNLHPERLMST